MAFKDDTSFLRFITMGALGARIAARLLAQCGHRIVELERYCTSNKIWSTKIKRLRVPDLLCIRCGRRFEIRAKSDLAIRMSHSQGNADRAWDVGMGNDDTVIFLRSDAAPEEVILNPFTVGDLRASQHLAKLGAPKSAGEGAERDLTWPAWVPKQDGRVEAIEGQKLKVILADGRRQTYPASGKAIFLPVGGEFRGEEQIVAAAPARLATLRCPGDTWAPALASGATMEELLTSLKALSHRSKPDLIPVMTQLCEHSDPRIRLETLAALERHQSGAGLPELARLLHQEGADAPWAMEAAFILEELATESAWAFLADGARTAPHAEVRAACVWSLRRSSNGIEPMVAAFEDRDTDVVLHAVTSAGSSVATGALVPRLIECLSSSDRTAACASRSLALVGKPAVDALLRVADDDCIAARWAFSSLSRIPPAVVRSSSAWSRSPAPVRERLELAWFEIEQSWLGSAESARIELLRQQTL